ncbi:MAG: hypothetical protein CL579_09425 [Alteromonadaceae bacterium]|jgi:hypothetical protein|nr:hypothetical protein [Alteromonadaceae bacterium]MBB21060.1 hypothetical protein [Rickettsiales bacterium]
MRKPIYATTVFGNNYYAKRLVAVCTTLMCFCILGCDSLIKDVKPLSSVTKALDHLEELPPRVAIHNLQPMFKVEAIGFTAVDETGWDWAGSDEIYAVWHSNVIVSTLIQGDVDSGDSFDFHSLQSCIYPIAGDTLIIDGRYGGEDSGWICKEEGAASPIQFSVVFYEDDSPWTHIPFCFSGSIVKGCEDQFVGKYNGVWNTQELLEILPGIGDIQNFTVRLNPCEGPAVCGDDNFSDYDFHFRIVRMADKEVLRQHSLQ